LTQKNAALVEQAAAAAASLQEQAQNLSNVVSVFNLGGGASGKPALARQASGVPGAPAKPATLKFSQNNPTQPSKISLPKKQSGATTAKADDWEEF
jgi:methyl-accepting chemotaxis protein